MAINSSVWLAGGTFELSYAISSSSTAGHEIESYAKTTGNGSQTWDGLTPIDVTVTVNPGISIGHTSPSGYALDTGNGPWPGGSEITIINNGSIHGKGGDGGGSPNGAGQAGGTAINIQYPVTIQNNGTISGGGGAGYQPGDPGGSTSTAGNGGHRAGAGGGLGAAGSTGTSGSAGAAGYYIKQNSNSVTWSATGTRNGSAQA